MMGTGKGGEAIRRPAAIRTIALPTDLGCENEPTDELGWMVIGDCP
jgi:hypothetical protein